MYKSVALVVLLAVLVWQCCDAQELWNNPGGPHQFADDLHRLSDPLLHDAKNEHNPFEHIPKDSFLTPPPRSDGLTNVKHIIQKVVARTIDATSEVVVEGPSERHLAAALSMLACGAVVFCGVLPALLFPAESAGTAKHISKLTPEHMNLLLSFAVGSLIGDVCLHIFPEMWANQQCDVHVAGLCAIGGLLCCLLVEKCCAQTEQSQHHAAAIMNLAANLIDNFTHGLAVATSFLINIKFGMLTTLAILLHEIPHEISDFAILLRADFNRWQAIKAQLMTASGGVLGAVAALALNTACLQHALIYVLAFTAGGFLNIALVEILPDLIKEENPRESLKQLVLIVLGVCVMAAVNYVHIA